MREHRAGRLAEATTVYEQALAIQPRHPDALHLAGVAALQAGDAERAVVLIQQAIEVQPENPGFHANLAQACLASRRPAEARAAFRRAVSLAPREPQFAVGAANCLAMQGSVAEAERELRAVARRHAGYALAWFNLGNVLAEQGRHQEAAAAHRRAIRLEPTLADAHNNLGRSLQALGRFEEAEQEYRRCVALQPDSATGPCNLASALIDRGRFAEAVAVCRQTLPRHAGFAELHLLLGSACTHQGDLASALDAFRAAANVAPGNPRALWAYGYALIRTGRDTEGLPWLKQALELQPDSTEFRSALSTIYLSLGELQAGWTEFEWRSARRDFVADNPALRLARELPENLPGRTICLLREQGLGDELFFLRFAAALKARGAQLTYCAHSKIAGMLARVPALDRVIDRDDPLPAADAMLLAGDLPHALGASDFPPPLALVPLPQQLEAMKLRLAALGPPPYLGLTWRAGTAPEQQRGIDWVLHKSIPLEGLGVAVRGLNGTLVALQRFPKAGEVERLAALAGRPVHDLTALNEDLEAILALMALLDDYIGVSNTNMHLRAGAGRTAKVLVPQPPEWRWMASGNESPWFPGFRIYRQQPDGDWTPATDRLAQDLSAKHGAAGTT
ncbi:MAG: tetratricopeptide repeat protein [Betaproteobacteria bacterium]|nr:tetratricopeptide repeat protein [Betaproteobacteria bacterium]